jgi:membrane protease YdiL (CAAX protease family)
VIELPDVLNPSNLLCFSGLMLFAAWLLRTSLGRTALSGAPLRPNTLAPYVILIFFYMWQVIPLLLNSLLGMSLEDRPQWQGWLVKNGVMCASYGLTVLIILVGVSQAFVQKLTGFGLGLRTIPRDFVRAVMILFCIWPVVLAMIVGTTYVGKTFVDPEYEIEQHQELKVLMDFPQLASKVMVVLLAIVMAPLVEEMLFRGILQSVIRSYIDLPWLAIAVSSLVFAIVHMNNPEHWPALFVLAMAMGYAYERSGSLWQSIFIHSLFNGITVVSYLV